MLLRLGVWLSPLAFRLKADACISKDTAPVFISGVLPLLEEGGPKGWKASLVEALGRQQRTQPRAGGVRCPGRAAPGGGAGCQLPRGHQLKLASGSLTR